MSFKEQNRFSRSSYRIAERNRLAKQRFLNQIVSGDQTDSGMERRGKRDLSVPGTPVSSRRVMAMKHGLDYDSDDENNDLAAFSTGSPNTQITELVNAIQSLSNNSEPTVVQNQRKYSRDFADSINEPTILNAETTQKHYPMYSSVPGTPVSSRHLFRYKVDNDVEETYDNIKTTEEGQDQLQEFIKSMEKLRTDKLALQPEDNDVDSKFGYGNVGTYNANSNLKPYKFDQKDNIRNSQSNHVNLTTPLTLNIEEATKTIVHPGRDLLSPSLVRKTIAQDGFYTRTYSRRISREEQHKFDQIENDIDYEQNGTAPQPFKRTSLPAQSAPNEKVLHRSKSNADKFYEILNRFRRNESK